MERTLSQRFVVAALSINVAASSLTFAQSRGPTIAADALAIYALLIPSMWATSGSKDVLLLQRETVKPGLQSSPAAAQQTFLPPAFQLGSKVTLNKDSAATYIVLAHQGAWIQVQRDSEGPKAKETWIYAPNGTVWTKER